MGAGFAPAPADIDLRNDASYNSVMVAVVGTGIGIRGRRQNSSHMAVIRDARHRQRQRRSRIALASALALAVLGWAWRGFDPAHRAPASPPPSTPRLTADLRLGGSPVDVVATREAIWVLSCTLRCSGAQLSFGELSVISTRSDRVIKQFPVVDPQALAVGAGVVWLAHFNTSSVTRLDPRSGRTTATIHLVLPRPVIRNDRRFLPASISVGGGAVWVSTARGQIAEIDPRTLRTEAMVRSPGEQANMIAGRDGTWVAENLAGLGVIGPGGHQLAIDPVSSTAQAVDVSALAAGGGLIWAYGSTLDDAGGNDASVVTAVEPRGLRTVGQWRIAGADDSIVYDDGALYAADLARGLVFRIEPGQRVRAFRSIRESESLVTGAPGALWVTTASGRLLRITLPGS